MSRLPHEYAYANSSDITAKFIEYFRENVADSLLRNRIKIFKETGGLPGFYCNNKSHEQHQDCNINQCDTNFINIINCQGISLTDPATINAIKSSETFKTIYLELLRDFEYDNNILIE